MKGEEEEKNQHREQNIPENNPSHGSSSSSDKNWANNNDHYVCISKQGIVFFEIFVCEIRHFV